MELDGQMEGQIVPQDSGLFGGRPWKTDARSSQAGLDLTLGRGLLGGCQLLGLISSKDFGYFSISRDSSRWGEQ